ncbi:ABC transporter substrate-binding protein [Beggiatoa leptomitoformis]|uniref:Transporter substrate-binding domain-containing protein n=1 Tax=Beggiatoa leptomitoformis TaxID=288004 RepID=A0A2N9YAV4_9GAMM|nr:ABC transporter substrate-binding protein [Beggiatoa leptomitoformis]ALG69321.2 transporter substrate-binding domain-containing protein [Beggiatoa leptomitoformis]AUI67574.1 transporter substrate-binding domain-containing protein [Beggiatoa leptomitoformis]
MFSPFSKRFLYRFLAVLLPMLFISPYASFAAESHIRVGVLQFGTVNWEMDVLQTHQLTQQAGVTVEVVPFAANNALMVALQGHAVDVVVGDWLWVSRQRAEQRLYTAVPYSLAIGHLLTRPDANIKTLADLRGKKLGIAGGAVDKNWLLMRAYSRKNLGEDLNTVVEPVFGAPPLLNQLMLRGELPAVINFWNFATRLEVAGMQPLLNVADVLPALGIEKPIPLLVWIFDEQWANQQPETIKAFLSATYQVKTQLATDDKEWERIRPLMQAEDDATFQALKQGYRAGIPRHFGTEEQAAVTRAFAVLAEEGGEEVVGKTHELSAGTFWQGFTLP